MEPTGDHNAFPLSSHFCDSQPTIGFALMITFQAGPKTSANGVAQSSTAFSLFLRLLNGCALFLLTYLAMLPTVRLGSGSPPRTELPHAMPANLHVGHLSALPPFSTPTVAIILSATSTHHLPDMSHSDHSKPLTGCGLHVALLAYEARRGSKAKIISVACSPMWPIMFVSEPEVVLLIGAESSRLSLTCRHKTYQQS